MRLPSLGWLASLLSRVSDPNDAKSWVVDVAFVRQLERPVTLKEIKESHLFDDWKLVRQSRLSTMSVPDTFVAWLKEKKVL